MCRSRNNDRNVNDDEENHFETPYLAIAIVSVVQLLLAPLFLCYSAFLTHLSLVEEFYTLKDGLWAVLIYISTSKITEPWTELYCKYSDLLQKQNYKGNAIRSTLLLFAELLCLSFIKWPRTHIILYGFLGGLFSAIISVNLKYLTIDIFGERPTIFETLVKVVRPMSLFVFPNFWLFLIEMYGTDSAQFILSAIILHIIPAILLIHQKEECVDKNVGLHKFQTLDKLSIEMSDLGLNNKTSTSQSSSSLSDEEAEEDTTIISESNNSSCEIEGAPANNSTTIYERGFTNFLPGIPEETEVEDEDDINDINPRRLSRITAVLQSLNEKGRKDMTLSVTNLFQPDESIEEQTSLDQTTRKSTANLVEVRHQVENNMQNKKNNNNSCFSISSDFKFELKRKRRRLKEFFIQHFVKSIPVNFGNFYIYPTIISDTIITLLSTIFIASAPTIALLKSHEFASEMAVADGIGLVVIIGFGWSFFLAGSYVMTRFSDFKIKIIFIFGLFITAASLFISQKFSNDNLTVSCLLFGFGHGIVSHTKNMVYRQFFGASRWTKALPPVNITTGIFVILIYTVIYYSGLEINTLLTYSYGFYIFNGVLWIVSLIIKEIVVQAKNVRRHHHERYPDYNF